jgi:hypothetical protein
MKKNFIKLLLPTFIFAFAISSYGTAIADSSSQYTATSCSTQGTILMGGTIGCDIIANGTIDLSNSYCISGSGQKAMLQPDSLGRSNYYYATLNGLQSNDPVNVYISGQTNGIQCTPTLNTNNAVTSQTSPIIATPTKSVVATPATISSVINSINFTTNLTIGSTGSDVTALQKILVNLEDLVMPAGVSFGYFGNLTQTAVAKYQVANGITPAVGYFGPKTRGVMNASEGNSITSSITTPTVSAVTSPAPVSSVTNFGVSAFTGQSIISTTPVNGLANYGTWDGQNLWITSFGNSSISEINQNGNIIGTYTFSGSNPLQVAYDGKYIWVASADQYGMLIRFDPTTHASTTYIMNPQGTGNGGIQGVMWDGQNLWIGVAQNNTGSGTGLVEKINTSTGAVIASVNGMNNVNGLAYTNLSGVEYVWAACNGFLAKINTQTMIAQDISDPSGTYRITTDGSYIYGATFAASTNPTVEKYDASTGSLVASWYSESDLNDIAYDGNYIWTFGNDRTVVIHNKDTGAIIKTIPNGAGSDLIFDGTYMWGISGADTTSSPVVNKMNTETMTTIVPTNTNTTTSSGTVNEAGLNTSYNMGVLVLKYFPTVVNNGVEDIDISVTGDVGDTYSSVRQKTTDMTNDLVSSLEKATTYLGYKDTSAQPSLNYNIVNTVEYKTAFPTIEYQGINRYPDYNGVLTANDICDYVDNKNVREVWIWAYQGPNEADGQPHLSISESKMSGPYGDISNSPRFNDMPVCAHTYTVYTFNYQRGVSEAIHSWGHQIESELNAVDGYLFATFQGPEGFTSHPQVEGTIGRCGSVHNPPNSRYEYDYANSTPQESDCLDWNPDSLGSLTEISCSLWGCDSGTDPTIGDQGELNYLIWMWQNLPGMNNDKTYQGNQLRNFWDVHGNFDAVMGGNKTLFLNQPSTTPLATKCVPMNYRCDIAANGTINLSNSYCVDSTLGQKVNYAPDPGSGKNRYYANIPGYQSGDELSFYVDGQTNNIQCVPANQ